MDSGHPKTSGPRWHPALQVLAVILWSSQVTLFSVLYILFLIFFPVLRTILIPYLIWIVLIDRSPENGGRTIYWTRTWSFWKIFASYFPISLIKTADLPSDRKYVFGYHPHGIIGVGAALNFASEATEFSKLFPNLNPRLLTLKNNFTVPFYRDLILSLGMCSVSMKSCVNALNHKNPYCPKDSLQENKGEGNVLVIVVGGAEESLAARPGIVDLTLKKRLGFLKLAIREGADLVPVISFGENDIFDQVSNGPGTKLFQFQNRMKRLLGWTFPLFYGRGVFSSQSVGILPYRHPIVSVVGSPIRVKQNSQPSEEEIVRMQELYIKELTALWDKYKDTHAPKRKREMAIVA